MGKSNALIKTRLILQDKQKVLLLRQTMSNGGAYTLIGGKVEAQETPKQAMVRESWEEAGLVLKEADLKLVHVLHKTKWHKSRIILFFSASQWEGDLVARELHKFRSLEWWPQNQLPNDLKPHMKSVLDYYISAKPYSEFQELGFSENSLSFPKRPYGKTDRLFG